MDGMDMLVREVVRNSGVTVETAEQAIDTVIHYFEQRLPNSLSELVAQVLKGANFREPPAGGNQPGSGLPTIHLSGMTKAEFEAALKNDSPLRRCSVCGHNHGEEVTAFDDEVNLISLPVEIVKYKRKCGDCLVTFPICKTCAWLLNLFTND